MSLVTLRFSRCSFIWVKLCSRVVLSLNNLQVFCLGSSESSALDSISEPRQANLGQPAAGSPYARARQLCISGGCVLYHVYVCVACVFDCVLDYLYSCVYAHMHGLRACMLPLGADIHWLSCLLTAFKVVRVCWPVLGGLCLFACICMQAWLCMYMCVHVL